MHDGELTIESITKIEGHASLYLKAREGKIESVQLRVSENKRFFEQAAMGKNFKEIPNLFSRICGTCSAAHLLCAIEAVEKAFDFSPSAQTIQLRRLLMNASFIRDHGMHLYYFVLPDLFKKESILEFDGKLEKWLHDSMHVRDAGVKLADLVGGRSIHPTTPQIGGFSGIPEKKKIPQVVKQLKSERKKVIDLIAAFDKLEGVVCRETSYVALVNDSFDFISGEIVHSKGKCIPEENYLQYLDEFVIPYSTAEGIEFEEQAYMVGALSRINLNKKSLHKNTQRDAAFALKRFPSGCVFDNSLAQAIEMLHCFDNSIEILASANFRQESVPAIEPIEARGVGVLEAPRGTLYHGLHFDSKGTVQKANVIIPTAQNALNIEKDLKVYIEPLLEKKSKEEIALECEKLVRAYDPCMSCATHFLKVKWI